MGRLLGDIILYIMSYFAQLEREKIISRQKEGIIAAKARGVKFGRKELPRPQNYDAVFQMWQANKISANNAAKALGVSRPTFLKWARS